MKRMQVMKTLGLLSLCLVITTGCSTNDNDKVAEGEKEEIHFETLSDADALAEIAVIETRQSGEVLPNIPLETLESMKGKSIPNEAVLNDLLIDCTLVKVPYMNFEGKPSLGEIIVNKKLANEVLEIFTEIYDNKVPIQEISLVDKYDADDNKSMSANNSSAFNYRTIAGTNKLSNHGKGLAIDINPLQNPHVVKGVASPEGGSDYIDRTSNQKGMIVEGDVIHKAFTSRGWKWGGDWRNPDYQHFEKEV